MTIDWSQTHAAIWRQPKQELRAVRAIDPVSVDSLIGIDQQKQRLLANSRNFLRKKPANNALLWGARGTGKSSLIKAVFNALRHQGLRLIEVFKNDLHNLPYIVDDIRDLEYRFIIYCDDFSFESNENSYMVLKTVLDGSIEKAPENIIIYATSNRRHLMPELQKDNRGTEVTEDGEIHYTDAVEEKNSLVDRFGLSLSFYPSSFENYLAIVDSYFPNYQGNREQLHEAAKLFAMTKASRSGRTAQQFYKFYALSDAIKN